MGYGGYSFEAHQAITSARASASTGAVFKQTACHPKMNPLGVKFREARDSKEHPESIGIVFALDVSGSMGEIPSLIARKELPGFMKVLLDCGIAHPQILFMAFSDIASNRAPLQVGQFESTAPLMDQWLTSCYLEGGGNTQYESYDLALYFCARHTEMDCMRKRKHRGWFFMTGDEIGYDNVSRDAVKQLIGDTLEKDIPIGAIVEETKKSFQPFFLVPDAGRAATCGKFWRDVLGPNVIVMETPADTCAVAAGIVALGEGAVKDLDALATRLAERGMPRERVKAVRGAIAPWAATLKKQ